MKKEPVKVTVYLSPHSADFIIKNSTTSTSFTINRMLNFYRYLIENVDPENLPSKETVEKIAHHAIESRMDPPSSLGELKALHLIAEEDLGSEIGSEIESCSILERMAMIEAVRNRINQILSNEGKDANYNKKKTGKKPSSRRN